jgi:hypothetical protein
MPGKARASPVAFLRPVPGEGLVGAFPGGGASARLVYLVGGGGGPRSGPVGLGLGPI